jgi:hypothetical protein
MSYLTFRDIERAELLKVPSLHAKYYEVFKKIAEYLAGYAEGLKERRESTLYHFKDQRAIYMHWENEFQGAFEGISKLYQCTLFESALSLEIEKIVNKLQCEETKSILKGFRLISVCINWQFRNLMEWTFSNEIAINYLNS